MANMFINAMSDLWASGGTTYNAIKMTVTNSSSASGSKILNLLAAPSTSVFSVDIAGNVAAAGSISATGALQPVLDGGAALGSTSFRWSGLYGASGFTLNLASGNWVATHSTGILTVGTGDLRVTNNFTNAASVVTVGGTQTLTAKTLTTPTINGATLTGTISGGTHTGTTLTTPTINGATLTGTISGGTHTGTTLTTPTINGATTSGTFTGTGAFTGAVSGTTASFTAAVTGTSLQATTGEVQAQSNVRTVGGGFVANGATWVAYVNGGATAPIQATASNVNIYNTLAVATSASVGTSITASGGNIFLGDGGSGRYLQFQSNYYLDWNIGNGVLRYVMGGGEVCHFGTTGITSSTKMWSETGYFVGTTTTCVLAAQNAGVAGGISLRPRGPDDGTFRASVSATNGDFNCTSVTETSDETLKSNWTPTAKSVVDEIANLEVGSFKWKNTGTDGYGVKAQALRLFMPEVVSEDEDGLLGVSYGKAAMTAVIDAAKRIIALEARIAELEGRG